MMLLQVNAQLVKGVADWFIHDGKIRPIKADGTYYSDATHLRGYDGDLLILYRRLGQYLSRASYVTLDEDTPGQWRGPSGWVPTEIPAGTYPVLEATDAVLTFTAGDGNMHQYMVWRSQASEVHPPTEGSPLP